MLSLLLFTASHLLSANHFNFLDGGLCTGGGAPRYPPGLRHFRCLGASPQPTAHPPRTGDSVPRKPPGLRHFRCLGASPQPTAHPPRTGDSVPRNPPGLRHFRCLGASPQPTAHPPCTGSPRGSSRGFEGLRGHPARSASGRPLWGY
jgi:hypothetical protein